MWCVLCGRTHVADVFRRYGSPLLVLNLVKKTERKLREVLIGHEFADAVRFLNKTLPSERRVQYFALDYSALVGAWCVCVACGPLIQCLTRLP
jgi:hypothetical protein